MSQETTTIPPSGLGKLNVSDFVKTLILSALANVLMTLYSIIQAGNWPTSNDWHDMLKATVAFAIGYLIKNALTNNTGQFLKKNEPVVTVSAEKLKEISEK